ncbi:MAG: hypothetical protein V1823_01705 [Chloroflexota bacterium]
MPEETVIVEPEHSPEPEGKPQANAEREEMAGAAQIAELESRLAEKEAALSGANERLSRLAAAIAELEARLARAAASYRTLIIAAHPEIPEDLISGQSVEEIEASLEKARSLVSRVRQGLEMAATQGRVPPGAPPRTVPDLSSLSPREKIQYGIGGKKNGINSF